MHDFMSSACAEMAKLTLLASGAPYVISTPGGRVNADRIAQKCRGNLPRVPWAAGYGPKLWI
jgi:hypothetical protein